jgi:ribosomal protein L11 methylase PrmA
VAKSGGAAMGDRSRGNVAGARSRWACNYLETGTQTIAIGDCLQVANCAKLVSEFGGRGKKLPRDWLKRFARAQESRPLKIGKRLLIFNVGGTSASRVSRHKGRSHIFIPAGAAFGTGDHATTALSLRLLEQLTRQWNAGWSIVDLGTGSGILALSAKCLGAEHVVAIDLDPVAISTAKQMRS